MAGLFYPHSAFLGLSGPLSGGLWASAGQPATGSLVVIPPASQTASSLVVHNSSCGYIGFPGRNSACREPPWSYIILLVGNFPGCLWGGPGFEVDFCLEPKFIVVRGGFLWGSIKKSVGSLPGRESACGSFQPNAWQACSIPVPPLWASLGLSLGLSGPQPASQPQAPWSSFHQPAKQPAPWSYIILLVGRPPWS